MEAYQKTSLWQSTLGGGTAEATRLRDAYERFRQRVKVVSNEIARDLPEYTVHDITHLDALWEMADLIAGPGFQLTPSEGFVFGGAILLHDLAMGLAAYPGGLSELQSDPSWPDVVACAIKVRLGRTPTPGEIAKPEATDVADAKREMLRLVHAKQASRLALVSWTDKANGTTFQLIDEPELRDAYGTVIGEIASSHWWPISKVGAKFQTVYGAPAGFPQAWDVDPMKIACLLRVADASHLDSRRAPIFLKALRNPDAEALQHWTFQSHLNQPRLEGDRLVYTSGRRFPISEANAWWLCLDMLRTVDNELRQTNDLLFDSKRPQFAASGIAGVDDPVRFSRLIETDGWVPVDARVRVANVAQLVSRLGGEELYGKQPQVALRELIQNGADAVNALRTITGRDSTFGHITVELGEDEHGAWLEVTDNGVGMSQETLTGPFVDFGTSLWNSASIRDEFPGLAAKGFQSTGKFGIGFFSVFMIGDAVRITTRKYDAALKDTIVLDFQHGLAVRPILRLAEEHERMIEGGTRVRVWLKVPPDDYHGLLWTHHRELNFTLYQLCENLCPALDVNLAVMESGGHRLLAVGANDWLEIDGSKLIHRTTERLYALLKPDIVAAHIARVAQNVRELKEVDGSIVGRACIVPHFSVFRPSQGVITVGGLRSAAINGIGGILIGEALTASRNKARPILTKELFAKWATEQGELIKALDLTPLEEVYGASQVLSCGGIVGDMIVAWNKTAGWLTADGVERWAKGRDNILVLENPNSMVDYDLIFDDVLIVYTEPIYVPEPDVDWPELEWFDDPIEPIEDCFSNWIVSYKRTLPGLIIETIAKAWGIALEDVIKCSTMKWDDDARERGDVKIRVGGTDARPIVDEVDNIRRPTSAAI